jgi:hypothetical protein
MDSVIQNHLLQLQDNKFGVRVQAEGISLTSLALAVCSCVNLAAFFWYLTRRITTRDSLDIITCSFVLQKIEAEN